MLFPKNSKAVHSGNLASAGWCRLQLWMCGCPKDSSGVFLTPSVSSGTSHSNQDTPSGFRTSWNLSRDPSNTCYSIPYFVAWAEGGHGEKKMRLMGCISMVSSTVCIAQESRLQSLDDELLATGTPSLASIEWSPSWACRLPLVTSQREPTMPRVNWWYHSEYHWNCCCLHLLHVPGFLFIPSSCLSQPKLTGNTDALCPLYTLNSTYCTWLQGQARAQTTAC